MELSYPGRVVKRISRDTDSYGAGLGISADGTSLVAVQVRQESNVWVAPTDDLGKARQITHSSINGKYGWHGIDWTPDGRIVFIAGIERTLAMFSMDADGSNIRQITAAGAYDQHTKVTADGQFVVFDSNRSGSTEIWTIRTDGTELRQITSGGRNFEPSPAPDGRSIVYHSTRPEGNFTFRIPFGGGEAVMLANKRSASAEYSPDGRLIACAYVDEEGSDRKLAVLDSATGDPVRIFAAPRDSNFWGSIHWMKDGRAITYRDWANGIWKQDINGSEPGRLEGLPKEKLYGYAWSRDGKHLAFARGREQSDVVLLSLDRK